MFRGQWDHVYVRFFTLEDTATVRALFTPRKFGKGACIKTTKIADLPPFLAPETEAKLVAEAREKKDERAKKQVGEITIMIPNKFLRQESTKES